MTRKMFLAGGCMMVILGMPVVGMAQTSTPFGTIPSVGGAIKGIFGGGKQATETMQQIQYALDKAHQAAELAELVQNNRNWMQALAKLGGEEATSAYQDLMKVQRDLKRMQRTIEDLGSGNPKRMTSVASRELRKAEMEMEKERRREIAEEIRNASEQATRAKEKAARAILASREAVGPMQVAQAQALIDSSQLEVSLAQLDMQGRLLTAHEEARAEEKRKEELGRAAFCHSFGDVLHNGECD